MQQLCVVAVGLFSVIFVSAQPYTCNVCPKCTGCSARPCNGRDRSLLDSFDQVDGLGFNNTTDVHRELTHQVDGLVATNTTEVVHRELTPSIPCTVENDFCPYPYSNYCCGNKQSDGTLSCGLGSLWGTCRYDGYNTTTANRCDFSFKCPSKQCCGSGSDSGTSEGPGFCSTDNCMARSSMLVACNYLVQISHPSNKTHTNQPTQYNSQYCGNGNRNSGRCRGSNLCCTSSGDCETTAICATKSSAWSWYGGNNGSWKQNGGTDGAVPCGSGTIGNGRCPTDDSTYGVSCCSPDGNCGSQYCNGAIGEAAYADSLYKCSCANGTPGVGTAGCTICQTCKRHYSLTAQRTCAYDNRPPGKCRRALWASTQHICYGCNHCTAVQCC